MVWKLKQLLPHAVWTTYGDQEGTSHFVIGRMWMGRCYSVIDFPIEASAS